MIIECPDCKAIIGYSPYQLWIRDNQACIKCKNCDLFIKVRFNSYGKIELVDYGQVSIDTAINECEKNISNLNHFISKKIME